MTEAEKMAKDYTEQCFKPGLGGMKERFEGLFEDIIRAWPSGQGKSVKRLICSISTEWMAMQRYLEAHMKQSVMQSGRTKKQNENKF